MHVEVGKLLNHTARMHKCRAWMVRDNVDHPKTKEARQEVIQTLYKEGVSENDISAFLNCSIEELRKICNGTKQDRKDTQLGKRCNICDETKKLSDFPRNKNSTDMCQPHCRECQRIADKRYRERTKRRPPGQKRHKTSLHIHEALRKLLEDTAQRHQVTMSEIVERAITKAMACTNCKRALRQVGGDDCSTCRAEWAPEVAA